MQSSVDLAYFAARYKIYKKGSNPIVLIVLIIIAIIFFVNLMIEMQTQITISLFIYLTWAMIYKVPPQIIWTINHTIISIS
jgi:uncharacterized protein (DUF983 family)